MATQWIYFTNFNTSLDNGPGVNERNFLENCKNKISYNLIIKGFTRSWIFNNFFSIISIILNYQVFMRPNTIVIHRANPFPFNILVLKLLLHHTSKIHIKTLGKGTLLTKKNRLVHYLNITVFRLVVKNNVTIDTVSKEFKNYIVNNLNVNTNKIYIITNGAPESMLKLDKRKIEKWRNLKVLNVCFLSNRSALRGINETLEICKFLSQHFQVNLKIIGNLGQNLEASLVSNKDFNINYLGAIPFENVGQELIDQHIGIAWFKPNEYYASPQKIYQYSANNLFVITNSRNVRFLKRFDIGFISEAVCLDQILININKFIQGNKWQMESFEKRNSYLSVSWRIFKRLKVAKSYF